MALLNLQQSELAVYPDEGYFPLQSVLSSPAPPGTASKITRRESEGRDITTTINTAAAAAAATCANKYGTQRV
jgi:hypothetical protein